MKLVVEGRQKHEAFWTRARIPQRLMPTQPPTDAPCTVVGGSGGRHTSNVELRWPSVCSQGSGKSATKRKSNRRSGWSLLQRHQPGSAHPESCKEDSLTRAKTEKRKHDDVNLDDLARQLDHDIRMNGRRWRCARCSPRFGFGIRVETLGSNHMTGTSAHGLDGRQQSKCSCDLQQVQAFLPVCFQRSRCPVRDAVNRPMRSAKWALSTSLLSTSSDESDAPGEATMRHRLFDLAYHHEIGGHLLMACEKTSAARPSVTCMFAISVVPRALV